MVEFMVIGYPRSATTWLSNLLTTDTTICLHDPLYKYHYSELDEIKSNKIIGVSCTGLWNFPEYLKSHTARKVIIHRDIREVNESLNAIGLPSLPIDNLNNLDEIDGIHVDYEEALENPKYIYEYLTGKDFDEERFSVLKEINMQPNFEKITINHQATKAMMNELRSI
jgi:hypothetical protein